MVHPSSIIDPEYSSSDDYKNTDVLYVGKYRGSEGQDLMNDLKIFRSSEMLLIIAEAEAAAGDLAAAAASIKTLRDARFEKIRLLQYLVLQNRHLVQFLMKEELNLLLKVIDIRILKDLGLEEIEML